MRKFIRVAESNWVEEQILNWEKVNGPVPDGMVLRCIDGNPINTEPDNWELITKAENLERNSGRRDLTDKYIIDKLTIHKPQLKPVLEGIPSVVELKRNQILLKRQLNESNSAN
jgi:hypothetical protein